MESGSVFEVSEMFEAPPIDMGSPLLGIPQATEVRKKGRGRPPGAGKASAAAKAPKSARKPIDRRNPALTNVEGVEWAIVHISGDAASCWKHMRDSYPDVYALIMRSTTTYRTRRVFVCEEPPPDSIRKVTVCYTKGVAVSRACPPQRFKAAIDGDMSELLDVTESMATPEDGYLALRSYQDVPGNKGEREITLAAASIFKTREEAEAAIDAWEAHPERASRGTWRTPDFQEKSARERGELVAAAIRGGRISDPLPEPLKLNRLEPGSGPSTRPRSKRRASEPELKYVGGDIIDMGGSSSSSGDMMGDSSISFITGGGGRKKQRKYSGGDAHAQKTLAEEAASWQAAVSMHMETSTEAALAAAVAAAAELGLNLGGVGVHHHHHQQPQQHHHLPPLLPMSLPGAHSGGAGVVVTGLEGMNMHGGMVLPISMGGLMTLPPPSGVSVGSLGLGLDEDVEYHNN